MFFGLAGVRHDFRREADLQNVAEGWKGDAAGSSFTLRVRARLGDRMLSDRLRHALDLPSRDFRREFNRRWEYEQADTSAAWDSEPDFERLRAALAEAEEVPEAAFVRLVGLAKAGSVVAMTAVGEAYYWGSGTVVDPTEAENWLRKAYELGSRRGLLSYGRVVYRRHDLAAAEQIFRKGADAGWPEASYRLADAMWRRAPRNDKPAEVWTLVEAAATAGHPFAKQWYGSAMARGRCGLASVPRGLRLLWTLVREVRQAWAVR